MLKIIISLSIKDTFGIVNRYQVVVYKPRQMKKVQMHNDDRYLLKFNNIKRPEL